jgi:ABC-type lipoprotein export system ATPase subunit
LSNKKSLMVLRNVKKEYTLNGSPIPVLKGVDFAIMEGEINVIMGPSGAGKSTLLTLMGLLDIPTDGEVFLSGKNTTNLSPEELTELRAESLGFVFQDYNLIPNLYAHENVALPLLLNRNMGKREREDISKGLLEKVGLSHRFSHLPKLLSGGEKQRVSIARALANNPNLILADEPTGNVDAETELKIIDLFKQLKEHGVGIVIVTHNEIYKKFADNMFLLKDGVLTKVAYQNEV